MHEVDARTGRQLLRGPTCGSERALKSMPTTILVNTGRYLRVT